MLPAQQIVSQIQPAEHIRANTRETDSRNYVVIHFEVTQETDGGYCAECLTLDIFTQADNWDELRSNVREAVRGHFFDGNIPERVRLHLGDLQNCGDITEFIKKAATSCCKHLVGI